MGLLFSLLFSLGALALVLKMESRLLRATDDEITKLAKQIKPPSLVLYLIGSGMAIAGIVVSSSRDALIGAGVPIMIIGIALYAQSQAMTAKENPARAYALSHSLRRHARICMAFVILATLAVVITYAVVYTTR